MDLLLRHTWLRRLATGLALGSTVCLWALLAPLLLPLAIGRDLLGGHRLGLTRGLLVLSLVLVMECLGLCAAAGLWARCGGPLRGVLGQQARFVAGNHALQRWWATTLWRGGQRLLGVRVHIEGAPALSAAGPLVVLVRHASHADTLLPVVLLAQRRLRFVLKAELLLDPCLDVVGGRLPNAFVRRGGARSEAEAARVRALGLGLADDEAVVLFPEGTRYTPEKRSQLIDRLTARGDAETAALARSLSRTLPPLRKGALALLAEPSVAAARRPDVVFVAHSGLEVATHLPNLLSGALVGGTVRVRVWRVPAAEVPRDPAGVRAFLASQWQAVDTLAGHAAPAGLGVRSGAGAADPWPLV